MSYVEYLHNRYDMDIPLESCVWLSNDGVSELERVFSYKKPILKFEDSFGCDMCLSNVAKHIPSFEDLKSCFMVFQVIFLSPFMVRVRVSVANGRVVLVSWPVDGRIRFMCDYLHNYDDAFKCIEKLFIDIASTIDILSKVYYGLLT